MYFLDVGVFVKNKSTPHGVSVTLGHCSVASGVIFNEKHNTVLCREAEQCSRAFEAVVTDNFIARPFSIMYLISEITIGKDSVSREEHL